MGALLELNDRAKLEQYFIHSNNVDCPKNIAQGDSIFDYLVNDSGQWGDDNTYTEIEGNDDLYFRALVNSC
jgi:hypothetical protein